MRPRLTDEQRKVWVDRICVAVIVLCCVGIAAIAWLGGA